MASTEGVLTVGHPGPTAGNSWTGMQANTPGLPQVNGIRKLSKHSHGQTSGKLQKVLQLLLIHFIQIKVITGYTFTFHSSRPFDIELTTIVFVIQAYERGSMA